MEQGEINTFQAVVWDYYLSKGRDLPWRQEPYDSYKILVSEIMLQQTQVVRVIPKYEAFLKLFPTAPSLASASLADVLRAWNGLGYNRRAKYLHEAIKTLIAKPEPWQLKDLTACKGIGLNTAAAAITYAYNQPTPFIETNIRTVYIYHFFATVSHPIADKDILFAVEQTLDGRYPREWFWALMDYGSHLKTTVGNTAKKSERYTRQPPFEGSQRQIRGRVLRLLATGPRTSIELGLAIPDSRLNNALAGLTKDGLIAITHKKYVLAI